jgi:hypothetical protein
LNKVTYKMQLALCLLWIEESHTQNSKLFFADENCPAEFSKISPKIKHLSTNRILLKVVFNESPLSHVFLQNLLCSMYTEW